MARVVRAASLVLCAITCGELPATPEATRASGTTRLSLAASHFAVEQTVTELEQLPVVRMFPAAPAPGGGFYTHATLNPVGIDPVEYWFHVTTSPAGCGALSGMPDPPSATKLIGGGTNPVHVFSVAPFALTNAVRYRLSASRQGGPIVRSGCVDPTVSPLNWPDDPTVNAIPPIVVDVDSVVIGASINPNGSAPIKWQVRWTVNAGLQGCILAFAGRDLPASAKEIDDGGSDDVVVSESIPVIPGYGLLSYQFVAQRPEGGLVRGPCARFWLPPPVFGLTADASFSAIQGQPTPASQTLALQLSPVRSLAGIMSSVQPTIVYTHGTGGWLSVAASAVPYAGQPKREFLASVTTTNLPPGVYTATITLTGVYGEYFFHTAPVQVTYTISP
ncbi:MAG TPA: hypothetical protein VJR92_08425 [Gemmatimonadaceae bacterium]|nr:hypothetical protein [Gemmatimonadaceae bacterium]